MADYIEIDITTEELENAVKKRAGVTTAEGGEIFNDYSLNKAGPYAHADGQCNNALGENSHVSGLKNTAKHPNQFVCGVYNDNKEDTLFEVGNGDVEGSSSNAFEVYQDGHAEVQTVGDTDNSVITKRYFNDEIDAIRHEVATQEYVDNALGDIEALLGGI